MDDDEAVSLSSVKDFGTVCSQSLKGHFDKAYNLTRTVIAVKRKREVELAREYQEETICGDRGESKESLFPGRK